MMPNPRAGIALRLDDPQTLVVFCDAFVRRDAIYFHLNGIEQVRTEKVNG
jgi:hypothetical protein